ncbi:MAG: hypothetical protein CVV02_07885 [Firmicutes bacterium HGW-Firmicutes-7]|nr:MAG: hypothetical protein CVV02_07885 [Firmicutes bacterium HGW-Firmicutes-7]
MTKAKIKQFSALLLILFIIFIFALSIYFALTGNLVASLSSLAFNTFFSVVLFFLLKFHRYVKSDIDLDNADSNDKSEE